MRAHPELAPALLSWYAAHARDLPWRATRDPYRILVSEVMLQQTQAARVVPHYRRFLARFPTAPALAGAPAAEVISAWSGLGYNRRALALQRAAAAVTAAGWPRTAQALETLPGVGPYTAAAVAAFAFGEQAAAVDTNVRRVIERLDGRARPPRALAARAQALLPPGRAADWNQAAMELGATVCTARAPRCGECPLAAGCRTRARGGPGPARPARRRNHPRQRFEETDRYARGQVLKALVDGRPPPAALGPERLERAIAGLTADGLVTRTAAGPRLP